MLAPLPENVSLLPAPIPLPPLADIPETLTASEHDEVAQLIVTAPVGDIVWSLKLARSDYWAMYMSWSPMALVVNWSNESLAPPKVPTVNKLVDG